MFVPAVSASSEHSLYSGKEINKPPADEISYIVLPPGEILPDSDDPLISSQSTGSVTKGQLRYSYLTLGSNVNSLEMDLNWRSTSNSLSLKIMDPRGSNVGTYLDSADGIKDGRIHLIIRSSSGYLVPGKWTFTIKGESVSGTLRYTFDLYTH